MTSAEAVAIAGRWPEDKTVPQRLRAAYDKATGDTRFEIGLLSEALIVASQTAEDIAIVNEYWRKG